MCIILFIKINYILHIYLYIYTFKYLKWDKCVPLILIGLNDYLSAKYLHFVQVISWMRKNDRKNFMKGVLLIAVLYFRAR